MLGGLWGLAGCAAESPAAGADAAVPSVCDGDLAIARVTAWPGGGVQIAFAGGADAGEVVIAAGAGGAAAADGGNAGPGGVIWATDLADLADVEGLTAVLVVSSDEPDKHAARLAAAESIVAGAPARDRVAVWRLDPDGLVLEADLTGDRDHVQARLAKVPMAARAVGAAALAAALPAVRSALAAADAPYGVAARDLYVVADAVPADDAGDQPVATHAVGDGDAASPPARRRLRRAAACAGVPAGAPLLLRVGDARCELAAPAPMRDLADAPCDAAAAAADDFPFAGEIAIELDAGERADLAARVAAASEEPFHARVRLGGAPIEAELHLRGNTSLTCDRKSYSVDLDGPGPHRFLPGAAGDHFYLLSLCRDTGYFRDHFAARVLGELGLFDLADGFVRLRVDGVNQGVYLLVEQPDRGLRGDLVGAAAVLRRREDPNGDVPDVKYPDDSDGAADALARYHALLALASGAAAEPGVDALAARFDLRGYLDWLAAASLLGVGDYVDEAFFYASDEAGDWYFRTLVWDSKDLAKPCHHEGAWAIADPCGLLYCAEADLDAAVVSAPALYRRAVAAVAAMPARFPPERLAALMDETRQALWAVLADDETAAAMAELVAVTPAAAGVDGARAAIEDLMAEVLAAIEGRRAALATAISACPEASMRRR